MADAPPPGKTPAPRRPRRPRFENATFGSSTPWQNPAAVYAYAVAWAGLIPFVGLVLGPVAMLLGLMGWYRYKRRPEVMGRNFAVAGIVIGACDFLFNAAGLWLIGLGLDWW